jgi:predicted O-linked N-acetylglucosamine transferase (SPINDLY family)
LAALVDRHHLTWRCSHAELAALCRSQGVDVLVDLSGHMQPNRLPALGLGAAEVVLSYLGYPGSTGLPWLNGRITDGWADPEDDPQRIGPEPALRVPGGYFVYSPPLDAPAPSPLPAAGAHCVTFGSFNDALKLNEPLLALWAQLLSRCDARLLLKTRALAWPDVRVRVLRAFTSRGIDPARIELLAATETRSEHLQTYSRVDVALDTFPYNGATTSCEALYMGVPVITWAGDRHASRMGVSILTALGLADLVATSTEQYLELALRRAADMQGLGALRQTLRARMLRSTLCDGRRVAHAIEAHAREQLDRQRVQGDQKT